MRAEDEKLIDLMFDNKRQYQIPVYQRNYDWKKDNCLTLFNDALSAYDNEKSHFLGTIVQVQMDEENGIRHYIIIDGQQRTTTIYLLLKALHDSATNKDVKKELQGLLFNNSDSREYNKAEKRKLKLKPIKSDNEQFILLMNDKKDEMNKSSNIYANYAYFLELIEKNKEKYSIKNILYGIKKFQIVMISVRPPEDDPQLIFERINSTGVDLSLSDLIRNYLLMTDANMDELYEEYWVPLEARLEGKITDFFNTYLLFKVNDAKEKDAYQVFKKHFEGVDHEVILKELNRYSIFYNAFVGGKNSYSYEINCLLNGYRSIKQTTIYPFLFSIFDDFENKIIEEKDVIEILTFFLNYTIRRLVTEVGSNSLRGLYKTMYKRVFRNDDKSNYVLRIFDFMANIPSTKDIIPSDTAFIDGLLNKPLYQKTHVARYLLSILENGIITAKEHVDINDKITIEHVMPQNENADWRKEIGEDYDRIYQQYLHTLGNLTLTGFNSELSDLKFSEKVKKLKDSNTKFTYLNADILDKETWNEETIKAHGDRLSKKLLEIFKLPNDFINARKNQSLISEKHYLEDGSDLSKTKPTLFVLCGEQAEVDTYTNLFIKTAELLYNLDSSILENLARNDAKKLNGTKPYITYDASKLRSPKEIGNTGIYIEVNNSANSVISIIKLLIDEYEFDTDDYIFYTKRDNIEENQ